MYRSKRLMDKPCMDNNRLIVISETQEDFVLATKLDFRHNSKCVGWSLYTPDRGRYDKDRPEELLGVCHNSPFLVLHWYKGDGDKHINPFPVQMVGGLAAAFAWHWLNEQNYGPEPDHDGSN